MIVPKDGSLQIAVFVLIGVALLGITEMGPTDCTGRESEGVQPPAFGLSRGTFEQKKTGSGATQMPARLRVETDFGEPR